MILIPTHTTLLHIIFQRCPSMHVQGQTPCPSLVTFQGRFTSLHFFTSPCIRLPYIGIIYCYVSSHHRRLSIKSNYLPDIVPVSEVKTPIYAYQLQTMGMELHCKDDKGEHVLVRQCGSHHSIDWIAQRPPCGFYFQAVLPTEEEICKFFPPPTQASDAQYKLWGAFPIDRWTRKKNTLQAILIMESVGTDTYEWNFNATWLDSCQVRENTPNFVI